MCGITGWYRRGGRPVPRDAIARACDTIVHRGPDDRGTYRSCTDGGPGVALGHRRLAAAILHEGHVSKTIQLAEPGIQV